MDLNLVLESEEELTHRGVGCTGRRQCHCGTARGFGWLCPLEVGDLDKLLILASMSSLRGQVTRTSKDCGKD